METTNEINNQNIKRFSRKLSKSKYEKINEIIKTRYSNKFEAFIETVIELFEVGLDTVLDFQDFSNVIEKTGLSKSEFVRKSIDEKISRLIREDKNKLDKLTLVGDDYHSLLNLKGKHSAYLRLTSLLIEVEEYNNSVEPSKRIFISKTFLATITGANSRSLKQFMLTSKNKIERINSKFNLLDSSSNRLNIKGFEDYLKSKMNTNNIA